MPREITQWPEEIIALNRELASGLHPKLEALLNEYPDEDWSIKFGKIAAYCNIVMDGMYEVEQLCEVVEKEILPRLINRRENPNKTIILN
jgi:hypothetical protein